MSEEDKDVATDTNVEVEEDTNISEEEVQEETPDLVEELEKERKAKSQILARAKKAEEELKILKSKPQENKINDPQLSDELKLIARGLSDEAIEKAKVIAKGKGIALTEAVKDPDFIVIQKDLEEKEKREEAKLGASKGSGETKEKVTGLESGSTRDEHKKAFKELAGKK